MHVGKINIGGTQFAFARFVIAEDGTGDKMVEKSSRFV